MKVTIENFVFPKKSKCPQDSSNLLAASYDIPQFILGENNKKVFVITHDNEFFKVAKFESGSKKFEKIVYSIFLRNCHNCRIYLYCLNKQIMVFTKPDIFKNIQVK